MLKLRSIASAVAMSTIAFAAGHAETVTLDTRIGPLVLENGYPSDETVAKIYDEMDFQRATQAYLWALPLMAMYEWQRQTHEVLGAGNLDYVDI